MASRSPRCAVGFRIKSGWATTVLLSGPRTAPRVLDCRVMLLADPDDPGACQPYHAAIGTHQAAVLASVRRLVKSVERFAHRSVQKLLADYRAAGYRVRGAGIVVGSVIDPAKIANEHIRAHAEEGRLFRRVVEEGLRKGRVKVRVLVEKELWVTGARLKRRVKALGESVQGPWRAEQKAAALAAWMEL